MHPWLIPDWRGRKRIVHPVDDVGLVLIQLRREYGHDNRWYRCARIGREVIGQWVAAQTVITSSPGTTQTITSDATWVQAGSLIEVIGGGASGAHGASTSTSGGGGGGGAYSKIIDVPITTPGTTQYFARVGAGGGATDGAAGGDSWWTLTSPGTSFPASGTAVGAKGGAALASSTSATGGTGGASGSAYTSPA